MKLILSRTLLIAAMLLLVLSSKAQSFQAQYTYDANGNRLTATVIYLSRSSSSPVPKVVEAIKVDPEINLTITIYPNPTQGDLRVELTGATSDQLSVPSNAIKVWDMQGRLLISLKSIGSSNVVDLSGYSNGTYIMQLFFGGRVKEYKIIKN